MSKTVRAFFVATLLFLFILVPSVYLTDAVEPLAEPRGLITEWTVPTPQSGPLALTLDQSGSCCWFLENSGDKLSHLNPVTNTFEEWTIPTANAEPFALVMTSVQGSPMLWGTEFGANKIFAFSPLTNLLRQYSLPHYGSGVEYISAEPTGPLARIWFTETIRNRNAEIVYDPSAQNVTLYEDSFPSVVGGGAYGVYAEAGIVWFAGFAALVRWDRASAEYTIWSLPTHGSAVGRSVVVDRNQVWYIQGSDSSASNDDFVGVLRGTLLQEWRLPSTGADPRSIFIDSETLQPWIAERSLGAGNGAVAVLSNSTGGEIVPSLTTVEPSGGTPVTLAPTVNTLTASVHTSTPLEGEISGTSSKQFVQYALGASAPQDVTIDSNGSVWVSEPSANKIVRISNFSPDFALSAYPQAISLTPGESTSISITGESISHFSGTLTITAISSPSVTYAMQSKEINIPAGGNASSALMIQVKANATAGIAELAIQASGSSIAHSTSILLTINNGTSAPPSAKPQCVIAAATLGAKLSSEVKYLRTFRDRLSDNIIGTNFLLILNAWYYSFSPIVADYIADHSLARSVVTAFIYPLLGSLVVASELYSTIVQYQGSTAAILSGMVGSSLIGSIYLGLPLIIARRRFNTSSIRRSLEACSGLLVCGVLGLLLGIKSDTSGFIMSGAALTVLSTLYLSAALTWKIVPCAVSKMAVLLRRAHKPTLNK